MGKRLKSLLQQLKKQTLRPLMVVKSHQLSLIPRNPIASILAGLLDFWAFIIALTIYLYDLFGRLIKSGPLLLKIFVEITTTIKSRMIGSLIWSRGRLGRPVIHFAVLCGAVSVFLVGGALQSNFVVPKPFVADLVYGATDMSPEVNTSKTDVPAYRERQESVEYTVQPGDTISSIGAKFNVSIDNLQYANGMSGQTYLKPGQNITIPPVAGLLVAVKSGDTVTSLAARHQVSPQAIVDINYLDEPFILRIGQKILIPGGIIPQAPKTVITNPTPAYQNGLPLALPGETIYNESYAYGYAGGEGKTVGTGHFTWPTDQRHITQYFSYYHSAIDIAKDSDIYAADKGTVVRSGWWPNGYGNAVEIDHGNGFTTIYAHMSSLSVAVGDIVEKGQVLGHMGNTGRSFGQHCHFVIQKEGVAVDPLQYF